MAAGEWIMLVFFLIVMSFVAGWIHTWFEARSFRRELERLNRKWPTGMRPEDWRNGGTEEDNTRRR